MELTLMHPHLPDVNEREVMRYAGVRGECDRQTKLLMEKAVACSQDALSPEIGYRRVPLEVYADQVCMEGLVLSSRSLARHVAGCREAVVFAASLGMELDHRIRRESVRNKALGLMLNALGAERIEAVCDQMEEALRGKGDRLVSRFSPGYGDLPLETQRDIFAFLQCEKYMHIHLTESLMMIPSKSVTAIIGILGEHGETTTGASACRTCTLADCAFRRETVCAH
ncbi:MAG: Vitamin B12 dependent methionine synthase activation subunit [Clostridia bacterium]|nr:Vitamin B12 dependent methionine synthase activation subunit [Clostridia bacterium]